MNKWKPIDGWDIEQMPCDNYMVIKLLADPVTKRLAFIAVPTSYSAHTLEGMEILATDLTKEEAVGMAKLFNTSNRSE
jgi:hypothetical protein